MVLATSTNRESRHVIQLESGHSQEQADAKDFSRDNQNQKSLGRKIPARLRNIKTMEYIIDNQ